MKNSVFFIAIVFLASTMFTNCKKDDDSPQPEIENTPPQETAEETPEEEPLKIDGTWAVSSTDFYEYQYTSYFIINPDNTLTILDEDEMGFRDLNNANYTHDEENSQITINFGFGSSLANYTLTEDELVLSFPDGTVTLNKNEAIADNQWLEELTILEEGDAPWTDSVDIAWNGSQILVGNGYEADDIGIVNPETFALDGTITTTRSAFAVEIEKFDDPSKYLFQSSNGSAKFYIYQESDNTYLEESLDMGAWIYGLASIDERRIWAASGNERSLYLYNYNTDTIEQTIELDTRPNGLDYQDGHLYVCANNKLFKCDVSDGLQVVNSYSIPNVQIYGVAYDGSNFWVYGERNNEGKLIKIDLTI
ncbi:MAG: hypothetical protein CML05_03230 [Pseudozobellia sp.]|nr:hypothetical protein [Pseudozobellia sp.]|tara:strand:- start:424 stop:1515 length:1092 start_codon:yes stop_codon:yes gene_type:complete